MKSMKIVVIILIVILLLWVLVGWLSVRNIEEPNYEVISTEYAYEVRTYDPVLIAKTTVEGTKDEATNEGFKRIADYIFGNNIASESIAMTTPVTAQNSEPIAMTAPVTSLESGDGEYTIAFIMPSQYTMDTLPKPVKNNVILEEVPAKTYAVIKFSGYMTSAKEQRKKQALVDALEADGKAFNYSHILSQYDPPWTPWFMRRNEIWLELN